MTSSRPSDAGCAAPAQGLPFFTLARVPAGWTFRRGAYYYNSNMRMALQARHSASPRRSRCATCTFSCARTVRTTVWADGVMRRPPWPPPPPWRDPHARVSPSACARASPHPPFTPSLIDGSPPGMSANASARPCMRPRVLLQNRGCCCCYRRRPSCEFRPWAASSRRARQCCASCCTATCNAAGWEPPPRCATARRAPPVVSEPCVPPHRGGRRLSLPPTHPTRAPLITRRWLAGRHGGCRVATSGPRCAPPRQDRRP